MLELSEFKLMDRYVGGCGVSAAIGFVSLQSSRVGWYLAVAVGQSPVPIVGKMS